MHCENHKPTAGRANDIDWMAFCYVSNEMSADQRDQFEERLADDQAAREAVADAVELTQTIAGIATIGQFVRVPNRHSRRAGRWQRATWIATSVAACLAIVLGYQLVSQVLRSGDDRSTGMAERKLSPIPGSHELAQAWLEAADETAEFDSSDTAIDNSDGSEEFPTTEDSLTAIETGMVETPDWMLAAVSAMSADASEVREQ